MGHSPEPWVRGTDGLICDANGEYICDTCGTSLPEGEENQKRIVACVNACAGIPTADLLDHVPATTRSDGAAAGGSSGGWGNCV